MHNMCLSEQEKISDSNFDSRLNDSVSAQKKGSQEILITGISGFVGTNLRIYLNRQNNLSITGSSRDKANLKPIEHKLHAVCSFEDIFSKNISFNSYVHLSGKVFDHRKTKNLDEYYAINYGHTKRLYDHFLKDPNAEKFIFLSTIHVLAEKPEKILDENYKPEPFTPYGKSKYKAEKYILNNCPPNKKVYVLRPSMIHGPGNKGNLNSLYKMIKFGIPYPLGAVNNKRSFVSIENLCFIINEIIQSDIEPGLYHVADDEATYTHDLIKLIANTTGKKVKIWNIPPGILKILAKSGNVLPLPLNEHRLNKLLGDFIVSNAKIKEAIGKPFPVTSKEGLTKTLQSLVF